MRDKILKRLKTIGTGLLITLCGASQAVNVNDSGLGEVLIYPYYTVNNNHNSLYSIVNTTADTKAVKITFHEGENAAEVLAFNVYLSAFDIWVGALTSTTSTMAGHVGEPSVVHVSNDTSCAPYLIKTGQEFLPFIIDLDPNNNSMQRATEGHIVVMELTTFNGSTVAWSDHGSTGVPAGCELIINDWSDNGIYDTADEADPNGGLVGSATLLNVLEGTAVGYDAMALEHFWQGPGQHTEPGSLSPSLGHAFPQSLRMVNGTAVATDWPSGAQAVSATLMQHKLYNEYDYTAILSGQSEWVITFPTKNLHVNGIQPLPPFNEIWNGDEACEILSISLWDQGELSELNSTANACYSTNVLEFLAPGSPPGGSFNILGSENAIEVLGVDQANATAAGWAAVTFNAPGQFMTSSSDIRYSGLPATGFMIQRFVNAAAPAGALAIYEDLFPHRTHSVIMAATDLIYLDGFEN